MEQILSNPKSFLQEIQILFQIPQQQEHHSIYYCLPMNYYQQIKNCINEMINKLNTLNESNENNNQRNILNLTTEWLPSTDEIKLITKKSLCIERRSVKPELIPEKDYVIIQDELYEKLKILYKLYSKKSLPHLPKIGVVYENGNMIYERELPSYEVKLQGCVKHNTDIVVKLSPHTTVGNAINYILYKNHIEDQFYSIELCPAMKKIPLSPSSTLLASGTFQFLLLFSPRRRSSTVGLSLSRNGTFQSRTITPRKTRTPTGHMKELWACDFDTLF